MMIISLLGHHTLNYRSADWGRLVYLSEGVKIWNSRRIWCLTKPFLSHVIYVIPVVEVVNELFNFMVRLKDHG